MNHKATISATVVKSSKRRIVFACFMVLVYLSLKFLVNSGPIIAIMPGLKFGLFNFAPQQMKEPPTYQWTVEPLIKLSAYKTNLSPEQPLKPLSGSIEGDYLHILGTDHLGRDVLAGWINGFEIALLIGIGSALLSGLVSLVLGAFGSYYEKFPKQIHRLSAIVLFGVFFIFLLTFSWFLMGVISGKAFLFCSMIYLSGGLASVQLIRPTKDKKWYLPVGSFNRRMLESVQPLPELVLLLLFTYLFPQMSFVGLIILLTILRVPYGAWYLQGLGRQFINEKFIEQSCALGYSSVRIVLRHLAPLMVSGTIVFTMLTASKMIVAESALSFFGIGPTGDMITWGNMIRLGLTDLSMWWVSVFPILGLVCLSYFFSVFLKDS